MQESSEVVCKGYVNFCGRNYYCIRHSGHGKLCMKDAFAKSCNIQCFEIAKKIKIDELADYAARFGLGQKTNFLLPEKRGLVPTSWWKKRRRKGSLGGEVKRFLQALAKVISRQHLCRFLGWSTLLAPVIW